MDFRSYVREHLPALRVVREEEIVEELAHHLDDVYRDGRAAGLEHEAAWAQATAALPKAADELAAALRNASRAPTARAADAWRARLNEQPPASGGAMLTGLRRDFRYALRTLFREPGFAAIVVITLALGIGGTTATYSAIDAILLQSAPVAEPDRVVNVYMLYAARATANPAAGDQVGGASYPDYADLRDSNALNGLAAFADVVLSLDTNGTAERIEGQVVTGNFFDVLGVRPVTGRTFSPDEDRVGSLIRVAVLSHGTWQRRFGADPGIVGRTISLNGSAYDVIGVAPRGFAGPQLGYTPELWVPTRVLAFTFAIGAASGLIFGLAPVLQLIRHDTVAALRDEGGAVATGVRATRARSTFVVVQVALSLVLLVGAGLFLRTLQQAYAVDLGYRVDRMLIASIEPGDRYTPVTGQAFYAEVLNRLNALPGVTAAGAARVTVLSGGARTVPVSVDGRPLQADRSNVIPVRANVVSERYLEAMGIPILMGRGFQATDVPDSQRAAIVNRSLAYRLWPNTNPIGQTLVSMSSLIVVGVVPDTVYRSTTEREPLPVYYLPLSQNYEAAVSLHVRTEREPMALLPEVRRIVSEVDPRVVLATPRRLEDEFSRSLIEERTMVKFVGSLSGIALLLAAVGLYGVMAYATRQRTTEIGVRLALGATPASILNMIVLRGVRLVAIGAAVGLAGALVAVRFVRVLLFGVEPTDPITWIAVSAVLMLVALVACALPARRAMRIDPAAALRSS